ncbi:PucR family transcriptional regulator [Streptomyces sp. NPDC002680]|uniref:PucR family transcriptional regulator n=1 Tax=Streptomyces sp. NPDC002680 TaxID=3364659 RepID=UPI003690D3C1
MTHDGTGCTLGDLLGNERLRLTLLVDRAGAESRPVHGARLALGGAGLTEVGEDVVLVAATRPATGSDLLGGVADALELPGSRVIAVRLPPGAPPKGLERAVGRHILLGLPDDVDPTELIAEIARSTARADETPTRRLTSLQRSLTQALTEPDPLRALTARVAKICNAVVTLVDSHGGVEHASGPLPLSLLFPEIARTQSEAQRFTVEGWYGMAVRIATSASAGERTGWLVAAGRRPAFPDQYSEAALYIAASLAETSLQIELAAQRQERAVRSAVLEEALALRLERHDAELAGRIASLGLSFEQETRVVVAEPALGVTTARDVAALESLHAGLQRTLVGEGLPHLLVLRESALVGLVQASSSAVRRAFVKAGTPTEGLVLGIGRDTAGVGHVVDSYHDAQLALRVLRRDGTGRRLMAYEEFDFATRLFSDVGLDRMGEWARELLRPLEDNQTMLATLSTYFEHRQNIMTAADALAVHHNSLRYRLSKIESALDLSLRDPSAVSSLFLALTALSMVEAESWDQRPIRPSDREEQTGEIRGAGATGSVLADPQRGLALSAGFGAALGPER